MNWVTTSQNQTASELRVNDVLTIFLVNDVLNVVTYPHGSMKNSLKLEAEPPGPIFPLNPFSNYDGPVPMMEFMSF